MRAQHIYAAELAEVIGSFYRSLSFASSTHTSSMSSLSSLRTDGEKIEIINQLLLPHTTKWIPIDSVSDAYEAIKSMKVSKRDNRME